jgi:hypothetical protein
MTTCGNSYLSINGARKCGWALTSSGNFTNVEFGAGESVELNLKLDDKPASFELKIFTGLTPPDQ